MTPQASKFNQQGWATLENNVRGEICSDTLYVVTGALFKGNNHSSIKSYTYDANGSKCPIPSHYYKVLLRTKSGNTGKAIKNITSASEIKAVAILLEHTSSITSIPNSAFISIKELEEFSGITFFPILNDAIEADVKKQCSRSAWDL
jgi:endonuclease G